MMSGRVDVLYVFKNGYKTDTQIYWNFPSTNDFLYC